MDLITRPQVRDVPSDPRRGLPVLLASAGYACAGVTTPLPLFAGTWWLPETVDAEPRPPAVFPWSLKISTEVPLA